MFVSVLNRNVILMSVEITIALFIAENLETVNVLHQLCPNGKRVLFTTVSVLLNPKRLLSISKNA